MKIRNIHSVFESRPVMEGAGVRLQRAFGYNQLPAFDPFLMLDDFRSERPEDFKAGFPWHPHRGMETITYVLEGQVNHEDSLGNRGTIAAGEVQWMTAGSGILHQELPQGSPAGSLQGFQLWANLPSRHKLMKPRYQNIAAGSVPLLELDGGAKARLIAGNLGGVRGPVEDILIAPEYLDITVPGLEHFEHAVPAGRKVFAYFLQGEAFFFGRAAGIGNRRVVLFGDGDRVQLKAGPEGARFLLISGNPLNEPVAWRGPIVMNTYEEIETAFDDLERGTFVGSGKD